MEERILLLLEVSQEADGGIFVLNASRGQSYPFTVIGELAGAFGEGLGQSLNAATIILMQSRPN